MEPVVVDPPYERAARGSAELIIDDKTETYKAIGVQIDEATEIIASFPEGFDEEGVRLTRLRELASGSGLAGAMIQTGLMLFSNPEAIRRLGLQEVFYAQEWEEWARREVEAHGLTWETFRAQMDEAAAAAGQPLYQAITHGLRALSRSLEEQRLAKMLAGIGPTRVTVREVGAPMEDDTMPYGGGYWNAEYGQEYRRPVDAGPAIVAGQVSRKEAERKQRKRKLAKEQRRHERKVKGGKR